MKCVGDGDIGSVLALLAFALGQVAIEGVFERPIGIVDGQPSGFRGGAVDQPPGLGLFDEAGDGWGSWPHNAVLPMCRSYSSRPHASNRPHGISTFSAFSTRAGDIMELTGDRVGNSALPNGGITGPGTHRSVASRAKAAIAAQACQACRTMKLVHMRDAGGTWVDLRAGRQKVEVRDRRLQDDATVATSTEHLHPGAPALKSQARSSTPPLYQCRSAQGQPRTGPSWRPAALPSTASPALNASFDGYPSTIGNASPQPDHESSGDE